MNASSIYSRLKKDVENFVKNKIFAIKSVDEILSLNGFKIEKSEYNICIESYQQLYQFKKILQLTINAFNDFDFYKNFGVKFYPTDISNVYPMKFYRLCDDINNMWKCCKRPERREVVDALYNYVLCFLSLEMEEDRVQAMVRSDGCPNCDAVIPLGETKCSVCDYCEEDTEDVVIKSDEVVGGVVGDEDKTLVHQWTCARCGLINDNELMSCDACTEMRYKVDNKSAIKSALINVMTKHKCRDNVPLDGGNLNKDMKINVNKRKIKEYNKRGLSRPDNRVAGDMHRMDGRGMAKKEVKVSVNQWTCARCGLFNDDELMSCAACNEMHMKDRDDDTMKTIASDGGAGPGGRKQWKCSRCDISYAYTVTECIKCHYGRNVCGVWQCAACTLINKCRDVKCGVCDVSNDELKVKYCKKCNKNMGNVTTDYCTDCTATTASADTSYIWECTIGNCQAWNDKNIKYCHKCKVDRNASKIRGDSVLRSDGREVWICHKCSYQNDLSRSDCCGQYCYETRYGRGYCNNCRTSNDGRTSDCSKCHKPL